MISSCSLLSTNGHGHSSLAVARQLACPGQTLVAADPASRMDLCAGRFRECECVVRLMGPADAWPRSSLKICLTTLRARAPLNSSLKSCTARACSSVRVNEGSFAPKRRQQLCRVFVQLPDCNLYGSHTPLRLTHDPGHEAPETSEQATVVFGIVMPQ